MKKKGFTIVELLTVVVILGIILAIVIPKVFNLTGISRRGSFTTNVTEAMNVAKMHYQETFTGNVGSNITYNFNEGGVISVSGNALSLTEGDLNLTGYVKVNDKGELKISLSDNTYCAVKNFKDGGINVYEAGNSNCDAPEIVTLTTILNGGTLPYPIIEDHVPGEVVLLPDPTRAAKEFAGWIVSSGDGVISGNKITMGNTDTVITAEWGNKYVLTVVLNGGTTTQHFEDMYTPETTINLINPKKAGYVFSGWRTTGANSSVVNSVFTMGSEDTTLEALYTQCSPGTFALAGATLCSQCPGGTYSAAGSSSCTSCAAGTYAVEGSGSCTACPAGKYSGANATSCTNCPAGTHSAAGSSSCTNCAAGTYAAAGSGSCSSCAAGTYSAAGSGSCTACVTGSYSAAGAGACTPCQGGKTTSGSGATSCGTTCSNSANVSTWQTPVWNTNNTMSKLCTISTCNTNYGISSGTCVLQKIPITINGALKEKITYSGASSGTITLNEKGTATVNLLVGSYTFKSDRALTTDFSTKYSRNFTVSASTTTINFYPAGAIYWYGNGAISGSSLYSKCGGVAWSYTDVNGTKSGTFTKCADNDETHTNCHNDHNESNLNNMYAHMTSQGGSYQAYVGCKNTIAKGSYTKLRVMAKTTDGANFDNGTYYLHRSVRYGSDNDFTGKKYFNLTASGTKNVYGIVRTKGGGSQGVTIQAIWLA